MKLAKTITTMWSIQLSANVLAAMLACCVIAACASTVQPPGHPDEVRVEIVTSWTPPKLVKPDELLVVVARKISVVPIDPGPNSFDEAFLARYRVLQTVVGDYKHDEIEFLVFDHYGRPKFAHHDVVLLPIGLYGNEYVHERYQFAALRKSRGTWVDRKGTSIVDRAAEWSAKVDSR